jgi:hypothetical protein
MKGFPAARRQGISTIRAFHFVYAEPLLDFTVILFI